MFVNVSLHGIVLLTFDRAGGIHVTIRFNAHSTAIGLSTGTEYIINEINTVEHKNLKFPFPINITQPFQQQIISKGSAPNQRIKSLLHVTIDANGNTTANIDNVEIVCK
ncbi:hypothetical protein ACI2OX_21585 [Bacillus sp. N9]